MVDHHGQAAALGLGAFADAIDDVGIDAGQIGGDQARVVVGGQADCLAGQESVSRMAPDVHHRVGFEAVAQPVV